MPDQLRLREQLLHELLQVEQGVRPVEGPCERRPVAAADPNRCREHAGAFEEQNLLGLRAELQLPQRTEPFSDALLYLVPDR